MTVDPTPPSAQDWLKIGLDSTRTATYGSSKSSPDDVGGATAQLQKATEGLGQQASQFTAQGADPISEALKYLKAVTGGDQMELLNATMPERRRVIDQYDTAKKSIAEFGPRGGGTAGALASLNAQQAGDLAEVGATARREGFKESANLGVQLSQLGLSSKQLEMSGLNSVLESARAEAAEKAAKWQMVGSAIGMMAGSFLGPIGAAAGAKVGAKIAGSASGA